MNSVDSLLYKIAQFTSSLSSLRHRCTKNLEIKFGNFMPNLIELSYFFFQISCHSSSSELANREKFRYYFQMLVTQNVYAYGFFGIVHGFGWRKVTIFEQDENLFTVVSGIASCTIANTVLNLHVKPHYSLPTLS